MKFFSLGVTPVAAFIAFFMLPHKIRTPRQAGPVMSPRGRRRSLSVEPAVRAWTKSVWL